MQKCATGIAVRSVKGRNATKIWLGFWALFEGFFKMLSQKNHSQFDNGVAGFSQVSFKVDLKKSTIKLRYIFSDIIDWISR